MIRQSVKSRRSFLKEMATVPILTTGLDQILINPFYPDDLIPEIRKFKKIDSHMHISSDAIYLREIMDELNIKMHTICNIGLQQDRLKTQVDAAIEICSKYPDYYAWCNTFGFDGMFDHDWSDRVIKYLQHGFDQGALGVKIWKEIGMQVKDHRGEFIQADDPIFDPILEFIKTKGKPLLTHIGDPVNGWLAYGTDWKNRYWYTEGADITRNRIGEFLGQVPFDRMMLARDRILARYPDLKMIGCHMGSLAFDLDEIGKRFERYPNFAVDTSLTVPALMGQAREKVREFFIRYQDRILYGLDESGGMIPTKFLRDMSKIGEIWTPEEVEKEKKNLMERYISDFIYYFTDREIRTRSYSVRGLALPESILQKIFYANAVRWIPGIVNE